MSEVISAVIFFTFTGLLVVGSVSTTLRYLRYRRARIPAPILLYRDRDLFIGLAFPLVLIAAARTFGWDVRQDNNTPELYWVLLTGVPPIYALARYCWYELAVIERNPRKR